MLFSNNDVILQSEGGEGVKKDPKNAIILNVWPPTIPYMNNMEYKKIWWDEFFLVVIVIPPRDIW